MPETKPYTDFGALWVRPDGETFGGKIYAIDAMIRPNPRKTAEDKFPHWHICDPAKPDEKPLGALWVSYGKKDGTEYLSGKITIAGVERRVSLWPVTRKSENAPHWRVLPPLDQAPEAKLAEAPPVEVDRPEYATDLDDSIPF